MNPLEAAVLIAVLVLPFYWLVQWQLERLEDPEYLREQGVVIVIEETLQAHSGPIGVYMGHPIWGTVTFKGMLYRFDRVIRPRYRDRIGARELYLDPGLVYLTD